MTARQEGLRRVQYLEIANKNVSEHKNIVTVAMVLDDTKLTIVLPSDDESAREASMLAFYKNLQDICYDEAVEAIVEFIGQGFLLLNASTGGLEPDDNSYFIFRRGD